MKYSKRIQKLIDLAPQTDTIADIGTDHGYIACGLLEQGKAKRVIATDVNALPLEKARRLASLRDLSDAMAFRQGPGLKVLEVGEANGAIIAGMGGPLIRQILEKSPQVVDAMEFLVLLPAQNARHLRKYLYTADYQVIKEDLVQEDDGRFYEYFLVQYQKGDHGYTQRRLDFSISPLLLADRHPLMKDFIESKLQEVDLIKSKLDMQFLSSKLKKLQLVETQKRLKEMLAWLSESEES